MVSWPRSKSEPSASDVRRSYTSQIEEFLQKVHARSSNVLRRRGNSLETLFTWGERLLEEKSKLENELSAQIKARADAEKERNDLQKSLHETSSRLDESLSQNEEMIILHSEKLKTLTSDHVKMLEKLENQHSDTLSRFQSDYDKSKAKYESQLNKLKSQLLVNQDEFKGWPDSKLSIKFKELQGGINSITAPHRRELSIPEGNVLDENWDPSGFITRVGSGSVHFLLQSAIWTIIHEHFFSLPFGFGVLGSSCKENPLLQVFSSWKTAMSGHQQSSSPTVEDLMIFRTGKMFNDWRSATFQSMSTAIVGNDGSASSDNRAANLSAENLDQATHRIMDLFFQVSCLSKSTLGPDAEDEVRKIVHMAREIGFQFGIHPSHLRLDTPKRGTMVKIGRNYHDCQDGDQDKGHIQKVDLVTLPGLLKFGDSRSDITSALVIVPCEIYPDN